MALYRIGRRDDTARYSKSVGAGAGSSEDKRLVASPLDRNQNHGRHTTVVYGTKDHPNIFFEIRNTIPSLDASKKLIGPPPRDDRVTMTSACSGHRVPTAGADRRRICYE
jgi:hypothetical protein